jgi:hypothetical protein
LVAHLNDIQQLPALDTEGLEIGRRYIQGYQETLSRQLQAAIDALVWMDDFVSRMVQLPQLDQQTLVAIGEGIQELMADVLPTPDFSTEAELPLTSMESWLARLEAGASKVLILQALAMDIIRVAH